MKSALDLFGLRTDQKVKFAIFMERRHMHQRPAAKRGKSVSVLFKLNANMDKLWSLFCRSGKIPIADTCFQSGSSFGEWQHRKQRGMLRVYLHASTTWVV